MAFLVDGIDFKQKYYVKQVSKNIWGVFLGERTRALLQSKELAEQTAKLLNFLDNHDKGGK